MQIGHGPLELTGVNIKPIRVSEGDVSEGSTECHAEFAAPHSSSEGEGTRLELERRPSVLLGAQTEQDQRIARLTDELALKSALLGQAEANAEVAARRAGLERHEHADRLLMQTSLVERRDAELVDMQSKLRNTESMLDELLQSRDQQVEQFEKELTNLRAQLEAKESELEAVRLRLSDAEAEADKLRAQAASGSVNGDEGQVTRRFMERMRAFEAKIMSKRWNEKSIEDMECSNEG
jgi:chromosome segregation ATPase